MKKCQCGCNYGSHDYSLYEQYKNSEWYAVLIRINSWEELTGKKR